MPDAFRDTCVSRLILRWGTLLLATWVTMMPLARIAAADPVSTMTPPTGAHTACPRPVAGSVATQPADLYSRNGVLNVALNYDTALDDAGRTLFCFTTPEGLESPTFHVQPGDTLNITLTNRVPNLPAAGPSAAPAAPVAPDICGSVEMTPASVNIHFHGTNTRPVCHSDQVIHTLVDSGRTFRYSITFPPDEPPGLYWYHPHVHGYAEAAVLGGATGAIVVEGIENVQPAVARLPSRILLLRDQIVAGNPMPGGNVPAWDVTLNGVPIAYPALTPAVIPVRAGTKEFWRVANTAADTIFDLHVTYDGVEQPLTIVALDGVPTGSQDGTQRGTLVKRMHQLLPPGARAEFILAMPPPGVRTAILETKRVDTGMDGDNDTRRILATLRVDETGTDSAAMPDMAMMPEPSAVPEPQHFEAIETAALTARRKLYFSEVLSDPNNPASPTNFYITVDGAKPTLFDPSNPPAIVTTQGSVELWTIENRADEVHEFHIHQIHFLLLEQNHVPVAPEDRQFLDTIQIPYWSGKGPYPSVTVAMDFRGQITGDFVYHCHILGHEDAGMMAIIRVLPKPRN